MAAPTSSKVGKKVTVVKNLPTDAPAAPKVVSTNVGKKVKYVPAAGSADYH